MDAPQAPIDITVTLGSPEGTHNLFELDYSINRNQDQVNQHLQDQKIEHEWARQLTLYFDFYVEAGREQEAIDYFNAPASDEFSPLQVLMRNKPETGQDESCKYEIEKHEGFVRVFYFFKTEGAGDVDKINENLQALENNDFDPNINIHFDLKGFISHNKKNRANVKVDYAQVKIISNVFSSGKLLDSLAAMDDFSEEISQISSNPIFELIKKSRSTHLDIKLKSFRKMNKYYNSLLPEQKEPQTKGFNYVNKGLFRQKVNGNLLFDGKYWVKLEGRFESEDVFIRLIKVYSRFFEGAFSVDFYSNMD